MNTPKLLSRDEFREGVFKRDNYKCVFCDKAAVDAHHIIERRLWEDGGYYMENGASVCEEHHLACEMTNISVEDVRLACGITKIVVPQHLYPDQPYDKWGNPILPNGQRLKGDIFFDESVQKILAKGNVLDLFTNQVKYPRTHHLPWSGNINADDRIIKSIDAFKDKRVIVTEKMDGENTTLYCDYIHARSIDGRTHPSRDWVKNFWNGIRMDIPEGYRVCGENIFAKHSIHYTSLPTYFMGFSVWNEKNVCLDWDQTLEWFELLGITSVPILYDGIFDLDKIKSFADVLDKDKSEGYVVRLAESFTYSEFKEKAAKYVRKDHIQTIKHWMYGQPVEKNLLSK